MTDEQRQALEDFAVAAKDVEVITAADRAGVLAEFDGAVDAVVKASHRLWLAAWRVRETRAFEEDADFMGELASGRLKLAERESQFNAWLRRRWGYQRTYADALARGGQIINVLLASGEENVVLPETERLTRQLNYYPPDDIPRVWEMAQFIAADAGERRIKSAHVRKAAEKLKVWHPPKPVLPKRVQVEDQVRKARAALQWLIDHNADAELDKLIDWWNDAGGGSGL